MRRAGLCLGIASALVLATATSCKKKETAGQPAAASDSTSTQGVAAAPADVRITPAVKAVTDNTLRDNVTGEVDPGLSDNLKVFIQKKGRLPQSFAEFANVQLDSVPRPPEGKKWVIDAANLQVKSVAK